MTFLKLIIPAGFMLSILANGGTLNKDVAQAQASTPVTDTMPARDAATSRDDINLTNSCVEAGEKKTHCVCVTNIFKHEMTLREYRAAVALYSGMRSEEPTALSAARMSLKSQGYSGDEILSIDMMHRRLSDKDGFKDRCEMAASYFAQSAG